MFIFKFTVVGKDHFPFDMLRYDACFPATGESAVSLSIPRTQKERTVTLRRFAVDKSWEPTCARWASFGWTVTNVEPVGLVR